MCHYVGSAHPPKKYSPSPDAAALCVSLPCHSGRNYSGENFGRNRAHLHSASQRRCVGFSFIYSTCDVIQHSMAPLSVSIMCFTTKARVTDSAAAAVTEKVKTVSF